MRSGPEAEPASQKIPSNSSEATTRALLTGFEAGSDEPDLVYAGGSHDVDRLRNLRENDGIVTLDEGYLLSAQLEDVVESWTERCTRVVLTILFKF